LHFALELTYAKVRVVPIAVIECIFVAG